MLPFVELRLGIPFGYIKFDLPIGTSLLAGTLGTIISVGFVLWLLPRIVKFLKRISFFRKILDKVFEKTRQDHSKKMLIWGEVFLVFFVAVPIPGSGGFSGALIAFLFGLPYWKSMKYISLGILFAGIIVSVLTVGIDGFINLF
jgi:uncharacterized membrane protein